jgi:hypothetical protein
VVVAGRADSGCWQCRWWLLTELGWLLAELRRLLAFTVARWRLYMCAGIGSGAWPRRRWRVS